MKFPAFKAFFIFSSLLGALPAAAAPSWIASALDVSERVQRGCVEPWAAAWKRGDAAAFAGLFDERASAASWKAALRPRRELDGIREQSWDGEPAMLAGRAAIAKDAADYLKGFAAIDDVVLTVMELLPAGGRPPQLASADELAARVRLDVRGRLADGERRNDRGWLDLRLRSSPSGCSLAKLSWREMETLRARAPQFVDATAAAGLAGFETHPRLEAIRRGGYALSVGDYDGDGFPDLLVGGWGPSRLYRNRGDGGFEDVTQKSGLAGETRVKAALIADMDGDGRRDLVLQRFVDPPESELVFYRNAGGGRFAQVSAHIDRPLKHDRAMSMAAADFDGDGRLDLYVAYPGVNDFTDPWIDASPAIAHQSLLLNRGGWRFEEGGALSTQFLNDLVRTHSALATDIDGDGRADLLVVDDRGNSSRLYINQGGGRLDASRPLGLVNNGWGMMAVAGDYDGDGRDDIYFTNIDLSAGRRLSGWLREDYESAHLLHPGLDRLASALQGNRLYRRMQDGSYRDVTEKAGVGWAGEAPAGAEWLDYNGDGRLDLYVANGLWSGEGEDFSDEFLRRQLDETPATAGAPRHEPNRVMRELQRSGRSFAGRQRHRLFRNNGDGTFTEVGYLAGVDRGEDGYVAAVADVDGDGAPDLVLRNADPTRAGGAGSALTLLRNQGGARRRLAVRLEPRAGADAFGARLTLRAAGKTQTRELRAVVGAVQSEAAAFFGLGDAATAESLEVRWPSGAVDRFADLRPGRVLLREGSAELRYLTSASPSPPAGTRATMSAGPAGNGVSSQAAR